MGGRGKKNDKKKSLPEEKRYHEVTNAISESYL
jgi:hypothetical protein